MRDRVEGLVFLEGGMQVSGSEDFGQVSGTEKEGIFGGRDVGFCWFPAGLGGNAGFVLCVEWRDVLQEAWVRFGGQFRMTSEEFSSLFAVKGRGRKKLFFCEWSWGNYGFSPVGDHTLERSFSGMLLVCLFFFLSLPLWF